MNLKAGGGTHRVLLGACRSVQSRREPGIWTDDLLVSLLMLEPELGSVLGFPDSVAAQDIQPLAVTTRTPLTPQAELDLFGILRQAHWTIFHGDPGATETPRRWTQIFGTDRIGNVGIQA